MAFAWDNEKIIFLAEIETNRRNKNSEYVLEDLMTLKKENSTASVIDLRPKNSGF